MKHTVTCECCGDLTPDDELIECPVCGRLVCPWCYDGEMCEECRDNFDKYHGFDVI